MSPLDVFNEFDEALDWPQEDDPLLEREPAPPPWPAEGSPAS